MALLLRGLSHICTFDDQDRELRDADILIDGGVVTAVGSGLAHEGVDRVIDGRGLVALPGLINAHQHLYQGAFRAIPDLERVSIESWLGGLGERCLRLWESGSFGADEVRAVARAVLLESLLGGVTTVADHHYFFPGGKPERYVEATIEAAEEVGVRLHAARGTMTFGRSHGGPVPDVLAEPLDQVITHCEELIDRYHDAAPLARVRIALAPCGVHVDTPEVFEAFAELATGYEGVRLHTHLYEQVDTAFCGERYGMSPWRFLERHGWANERSWLAHVVHPPSREIEEFAASGVGLVHLVAPDLRMGWGLAPLREFLESGVTVGFGTTGSASNDGANLLGDLRLALLAHRCTSEDPRRWPSARELLALATRGSAACLGRSDLGAIEPGRAADIACWDMRRVDRIGVHDPVAGLLLTGLSQVASLVLVGGAVAVEDGQPTRLDPYDVARRARSAVHGAALGS